MSLIEVRKFVTIIEEIWHEGGPVAATPLKVGAIAAVLKNPYAGGYVQDILPLMDALKPFGQSNMLPVGSYLDEEVLAWEKQHIFSGWVALGRSEADYLLDSYRGLYVQHCEAHGTRCGDRTFEE